MSTSRRRPRPVITLIDFLNDRINEDEQWARLASEPPNNVVPAPADGVHWDWVVGPDFEPLEMPDPFSKEAKGMLTELGALAWLSTVEKFDLEEVDEPSPGIYSDGIHNMDGAAAALIVRYDPARVLREVTSKRRIMQRHTTGEITSDHVYCRGCPLGADGAPAMPLNACPELRDLAAVYSGHPDYDPKWKPEP